MAGRLVLLYHLADLIAGRARHFDINEDNIGLDLNKLHHRGVTVSHREYVDAFVGKRQFHDLADRGRVVSQ
jgi:hypothetical protein